MRIRDIVLLGALAMACLSGCGGKSASIAAPAPERESTSGDSVLAAAPAGADLILEVDLQRLRENPSVGPLLANLAAPTSLQQSDLLQVANVALLCIYDIGDKPRQIIILQSDVPMEGATDLGQGLFAVGDSGLLAQAEALPESGHSMAEDAALLNLRAQAMPEKAKHAVVRLAAHLDFDARVSIAAKVAVSEVPVSIALWGDVIDDLAIVVELKTETIESLPTLERAIIALKTRIGRQLYVRYLGLVGPLQEARVVRTKDVVRVIFVIGPNGLSRLVERIQRQLQRQSNEEQS